MVKLHLNAWAPVDLDGTPVTDTPEEPGVLVALALPGSDTLCTSPQLQPHLPTVPLSSCTRCVRSTMTLHTAVQKHPALAESRHTFYLICRFAHCQSARDFSSTSPIHHTIITDEVPDDAQGVVKRSLCFLDDLWKTVLPELM